MTPSHPVRPLPSVRRRVLLGLGAAAVPAAVLGLPEVAGAVPAGPGAPAEPVLPLEPVDPAVTGGETVILDQVLADLAPVTDDPDSPLRRIEDVAATMIGCTWQGEAPEEVWVRGRAEDGAWSPWLEAERAFDPETGDAADGTEPSWLGGSFAVDVRASRGGEDVTGELTAHIVTTSPRKQDDGTALFTAGAGVGATGRIGVVGAISSTAGTSIGPNAPTVISRAQWGADESLVRSVSTSSSLKGVVLHHTAGANSYSQAESAQQVRGILSYHTKTLGWSDIGYNFLIDRYGQVFEARHGGMTLNVVGAHALGFNTGTCGISVMGDFTSSAPPQVAIDAAMTVAAWKLLGTMRTDISEKVSYTVGIDGTRFPKGSTQSLPRFYAHRDVGTTSCPGDAFYGRMSSMRSDLQRRIDTGWRGHLDAFRAGGGADALGSVKEVAHPVGSYTVTILTKGIILSDGLSNSVAYATPFADDWKPEWGRPFRSASSSGGVTTQVFENGTARRPDGGSTTFTAGSPIPDGPVADGVYSVAHAPTLYKVSGGVATKLSGSDWAALGYPAPTPAPTDYVRYRWSGTIVAVTKWGKAESTWGVQHLDAASWSRAGSPTPRVVAYVPGSTFYRWSTAPGDMFVEDQGGVKHKLSYSEWTAAGSPGSSLRSDQGYQKLSWDPAIAFMTSVSKGQGGPINGTAWAAAGYPAPQAVQRFPGDQIYWGTGGDIWYAGPTVNRKLSYAEWKALGSPWPAAAKR